MPSVADLVESHLLRALTDADTYAAGVALADSGAVTFDQFGPLHVRAWVEDGERFLADLYSGPGRLAWSCSEPGGARGAPCLHCVAAAVETRRYAPARTSGVATSEDVEAHPLPEPTAPAPPHAEAFAPPTEPHASVEPELAPTPGAEPVSADVVVEAPTVSTAQLTEPEPDNAPAFSSALVPEATLAPDAQFVPDRTLAPDTALAPGSEDPGIIGVHAIVFTPDSGEVRAFFRETLGMPHVDAGGGWLIFALPPAELAVHPADRPSHAIYFMCDDLEATLASLERKGVEVRRPVRKEAWGLVTEIVLPGGTEFAIYEPTHRRPQAGPGQARD